MFIIVFCYFLTGFAYSEPSSPTSGDSSSKQAVEQVLEPSPQALEQAEPLSPSAETTDSPSLVTDTNTSKPSPALSLEENDPPALDKALLLETSTSTSPIETNTDDSEQTEGMESHTEDLSSSSPPLKSFRNFLDLGVEYPINFGLHLRYHFLEEMYVRLGFGFMSSFFLNSFEKISPSLGFLEKSEAKILSEVFKGSMYWDLRLGWSPYFKKIRGGPYIELGLSSALLAKGELRGSLLNEAISFQEQDPPDEDLLYSVRRNSYNGTLHIGYQIPFDQLKLNLELGLVKILGASVIDVSDPEPANPSLTKFQEKDLTGFLIRKGWIFPTLSAWISFSF